MRTIQCISMAAVAIATLGLIAACGGNRSTTYVVTDATAVTPEQQLLIDAEAAWALRDDRAQLETAIAKWEAYLELDPNNGDVLGMTARACYLLANGHLTDEEQMLAWFDKGASYGERGMASNDAFKACVDGGTKDYKCLEHLGTADLLSSYWVYANLGKWSATMGFTYIVKNKSKLKALADWVQATDPNFFYGAGDRLLGTYYAKAPAAFGGDMGLSMQHFEASLAIAPDYLGTKVLMAQYYATKAQDQEMFERLCNEVLAADPESIPEIAPEQRLEQGNAQRLLDQVGDLF
jgi:tetratricopeptide (TPR) repeat protein